MMDSVFTKIIKGELPAHKIYEDERCIVILDIAPVQPGHCLVIPKEQVEFIWDVDNELYHYLWDIAKKVALHLRTVMQSQRVSVIIDGEAVPHAHIQLIPTTGAHDIDAPRPTGEPDHTALAAVAQKLQLL